MTDNDGPIENITPDPIPDADMRLIIATEYGVYRQLIAADALTIDGMQRLNRQLVLPDGPIHPAEAHQDAHRQALLAELHAKLVVATGFPLDHWQQAHRPDVPDDLSGIEDGA